MYPSALPTKVHDPARTGPRAMAVTAPAIPRMPSSRATLRGDRYCRKETTPANTAWSTIVCQQTLA